MKTTTIFNGLKFVLLLSVFLFAQAHRAPQTMGGTIMGVVFGPDSLPVSDAHILIKNGLPATVSNRKGYFQLSPLPQGIYTIKIDHVAYRKKFLKNIRVRANSITQLDTVFLKPKICTKP